MVGKNEKTFSVEVSDIISERRGAWRWKRRYIVSVVFALTIIFFQMELRWDVLNLNAIQLPTSLAFPNNNTKSDHEPQRSPALKIGIKDGAGPTDDEIMKKHIADSTPFTEKVLGAYKKLAAAVKIAKEQEDDPKEISVQPRSHLWQPMHEKWVGVTRPWEFTENNPQNVGLKARAIANADWLAKHASALRDLDLKNAEIQIRNLAREATLEAFSVFPSFNDNHEENNLTHSFVTLNGLGGVLLQWGGRSLTRDQTAAAYCRPLHLTWAGMIYPPLDVTAQLQHTAMYMNVHLYRCLFI